jgi:alkylhydroperoxidase family enzyme
LAARIPEAQPPFPGDVQERLEAMMPKGVAPLLLFTTLARDPRLFKRFLAGSLLDKGNLSLRHREIVIDRITALSRSEYEWGVHVAFFAERAGLDEAQVASTAQSGAADPVWNDQERALLTACDQLHATCDIDDKAWSDIRRHFPEEAILEILMLAGSYRMVSYLTNALRLPLESFGRRFPQKAGVEPGRNATFSIFRRAPVAMAFACLTWAAA